MSAETNGSSERRMRVDEAIAAYLEAVDAGTTPAPEEFIAQHRDIADELTAFLADSEQFERFSAPLQSASGVPKKHASDLFPSPNDSSNAGEGVSAETGARDFGDYELLAEIVRGGMGVVYRARQISLNRIVALKVILAGHFASHEEVRRFGAEAEAAANLDHPGIVPIYEVGEHNGQHFFSMGYIEGHTLAARLKEGPLPSRDAAALLKQVCEAVEYAHEHDVIHRDLKPANILLERCEDTSANSQEHDLLDSSKSVPGSPAPLSALSRPRVTDFGLAMRLSIKSDLTATGQILGTPGYMSPEQASGASHRIGRTSDVYSLGAILYQLLTGRPPFQAETALNTLTQLLDSDPVPPRLLNRNVPRELEAICIKCLEKDPQRRYPSARELGSELGRYLEGEPIHASGINLLDRMNRALRQSRHEEYFRGWGLGLMAFGLVIFLSHAAIFVLERTWSDPWTTYFLPRCVMFTALLVMLWRFRHQSVLPTNSAERLIWVVWTGYLISLGAVNTARSVLGHSQRESYAVFAVLTGFGFLIMGGHVWGGGYVVGLIFMVAAPILAMYAEVAPLAFGALWAAALLTFGIYYWRRGRVARSSDSGEAA